MRNIEKDAIEMTLRKQKLMEEGFRLFSEKNIDAVSLLDVAKACGCGIATLYRYYNNKLVFVIAVGTWAWERYIHESIMQISDSQFSILSAAELFEKYLDFFIDLYKHHADLLRFNQFFNIYVRGEDAGKEQLAPYLEMIQSAAGSFHKVYSKAENDGTVRTDISEEEMFTSALHLMLAAVTRYAVGLVYTPKNGAGEENELRLLKELLLEKYVVRRN